MAKEYIIGNVKGIQGNKGDTGATGATGATPNIAIGTVTTGNAGTQANATITGITPNLQLDLTLPRGTDGTIKGKVLVSGEDLNSYTETNVVYCSTDEIAKTILNRPFENAFGVFVIPQAICTQVAVSYIESGVIKIRQKNVNANWSGWTNIADGGNADTVDGKHSNEFVNIYSVNGTSHQWEYFKIAELITNIAEGLNGVALLISGVSNYGNPRLGVDLLQVSTRGGATLQVFGLTDSDADTKYGYVNNEHGTTEIWMRKGSFIYSSQIEILFSEGGSSAGNLGHQIEEPTGIVYVDKNKYVKTTDTIANAVRASMLDVSEALLSSELPHNFPLGVKFYYVYEHGYPITWGNLMSTRYNGNAVTQLLMQWGGNNLFIRSCRDIENEFTVWERLAKESDLANYIPVTASCNKKWHWSAQAGQPPWVWGGIDGADMYVYNPANFSVNHANHALLMRTFSQEDASHGDNFLLKCKYNLYGDDRFGLYTVNPTGHQVRVDYATDADKVDGKHATDLQNYNNLSNRPTIPTNTTQLTNGSGYITSSSIPSSLPANGGNADTVDGKHAIDFADAYLDNVRQRDLRDGLSFEGLNLEDLTRNTSVGVNSLTDNSTGAGNVAMGEASLLSNSIGSHNVAIGSWSLARNYGSNFNTAIGESALVSFENGENNTALGFHSLGMKAEGGSLHQCNNCTGVGAKTRVSGDNQVQLGDSSTTVYTYGAVQNRSDARDKTDIKDITIGLDFINALTPRCFKWDYREAYNETVEEDISEEVEDPESKETKTITRKVPKLIKHDRDGSKSGKRYHNGLIAQEVKQVMDDMGVDFAGYQDHSVNGGEDVLSIGYGELIPVLIKAVQELTARVKALEESSFKEPLEVI